MESPLYNISEALICFAPVFLIVSMIGGALLWNSWPGRKKKGELHDDGTGTDGLGTD